MTIKTDKNLDRLNAINSIRDILNGDDIPVIYTVSRATRSGGYGISQDISLFYFKGGTPWNLTYYAGKVLDMKVKSKDGYNIINNIGGNMDLGFDLVYNLSYLLYPSEKRPGYFISHRWL